MKQLTAPDYHNFDEEKRIFGEYVEPFLRPKDDEKDKKKKKGDLIGFIFKKENGSKFIVGNSHIIEKALKDMNDDKGVTAGDIVGFEFQGKEKTAKGQNVNIFDVYQFDSVKEASEFWPEETGE